MPFYLAFLATLMMLLSPSSYSETTDKVDNLIPTLTQWAQDPTIVDAIKNANTTFKTQSHINAVDKEWQDYSGISPLMLSMLESEAAKKLLSFESSASYYQEIFITDKFGTNVAMTAKTSDYWQGDEKKFTQCFNKGEATISSQEFDKSAQKNLIHISIPVISGSKVIGVMVVGVSPSSL